MTNGIAQTRVRRAVLRLGEVPETVRNRVAAADVAQVNAWIDAVLDAPGLGAAFGEPVHPPRMRGT